MLDKRRGRRSIAVVIVINFDYLRRRGKEFHNLEVGIVGSFVSELIPVNLFGMSWEVTIFMSRGIRFRDMA